MDTRSCTEAPGSEDALEGMEDSVVELDCSDCSSDSRGMISSSDDTESPVVTGARVEAFFGWMKIGGAML